MEETQTIKTPWHLWVVGALALMWNAFGAADYVMSQTGNAAWFAFMGVDAATTEAMIGWIVSSPWWTHAAWAFGVWGAVAGTLLLLFRSRWAVSAFGLSIAGVVVSMVYQSRTTYPPGLEMMEHSNMMWIVLTIAALLLIYAEAMKRRGVLS